MPYQPMPTQAVQKPLISFIVTCYEQSDELLCECLKSIFDLTLRSYEREVIVIDDGSKFSPLAGISEFTMILCLYASPMAECQRRAI